MPHEPQTRIWNFDTRNLLSLLYEFELVWCLIQLEREVFIVGFLIPNQYGVCLLQNLHAIFIGWRRGCCCIASCELFGKRGIRVFWVVSEWVCSVLHVKVSDWVVWLLVACEGSLWLKVLLFFYLLLFWAWEEIIEGSIASDFSEVVSVNER
jgi:hypothetical protein